MITEQLARFVTETRLSDIPGEMLIHAQDALMDTVGCALAGAVEPVAEIALTWLNELGARPQATVWGQTVATSPAEAAFANGISAHALDFDDSLPTLRGHPSATMVPAALAVAEIAGVVRRGGAGRIRPGARNRRQAWARDGERPLLAWLAQHGDYRRVLLDRGRRAVMEARRADVADGMGSRSIADERTRA